MFGSCTHHAEGDFVVWFEIHVLPLPFLKKKGMSFANFF